MKKIISMLFFAFLLVAGVQTQSKAQANTVVSMVSQYGNTTDTVVNTGTKYLYNSVAIGGFQKVVTVAVHLIEISGTTGGTITVEASLDGTNYYPFYVGRDSSTAITNSYTFTPADAATNDFRFSLFDFRERWVRVKYTGTGTMSDKISAKILY